MKKVLCLCAMVMAMAMTAVSARAADITGSWTGTMNTPDGNSMTMGYTFKVDGSTLTGTINGPMGGDPMPFTDGKIDGNNISFKISFNGMTITNTGVINDAGDEIKLTSKSDGGDFPGMEITLKKGAAAPAAAPAPQL